MGLALIYASRVIDGLSGGNISTAAAYISDVTGPENRAKGMGLIGAAFGLGFIFGPAAGGVMGHFSPSLPAYAAAFLGSTQIKPGRFNVWGAVIAVYVLATGVRGLQLVTSVQWLNDMFNGVALIAAVAFAVWRQGKASDRRRTGADTGALETPGEADAPAAEVGHKEGYTSETVTTPGTHPPH
jgi:MFS family permease